MNPLRHLARPALRVIGRGRLTILIYHRVRPEIDALFPGDLDARRFDEQMSWIGAMLNVLPLGEAVEMLPEGRLPARAACITFDDGYRDNLDIGLPILRRHRLPATVFVASGFLDGGRMWNDTIIESIRRAPAAGLDLGFLGLGQRGLADPVERRTTIQDIIRQLKYLAPDVRLERANAVARLVNRDLPDDLMLRSEQVRELHGAGITIGAHTVSHPILARLDDDAARAEIRDSKLALEAILGTAVSLFAYPNGRAQADYGDSHVAIVRELGFKGAVSTRPGAANRRSDPFRLPRYSPWGRSLPRFAANLVRNYLGQG